MTPREYLSWSSLNTLGDFSPKCIERWKEIYIYDNKFGTNRGMAFGKMMATGLEDDESTGDDVLDAVMTKIPKFEIMDKVFYANLKTGKRFTNGEYEVIKILCKPDTMKADMTGFKEDKTAQKKWTKKQVDEFGQITFYAMGMYLVTGKIPYDIELVEVPTKMSLDGKMECTGDIIRHPTVRTMSQILNMMVRCRRAWSIIKTITEEELL